ncbi:MAG: DoxX family protein [Janthinobacterium lividum]
MKKKQVKDASRIILGSTLIFAGISHLTFARDDFRAQVPNLVPMKKDDTVIYSGFAEIALGGALVLTNKKYKDTVGKIAATFFTAVFPGNIAQYIHKRNAFGLDTDKKRFIRLLFQPALVYWALKSTSK